MEQLGREDPGVMDYGHLGEGVQEPEPKKRGGSPGHKTGGAGKI